MSKLSKREAIEFLGLDSKVFDNYFKSANEFTCMPRTTRSSRFYFNKSKLADWLKDYKTRCIKLSIADYLMCLDFALAMHFQGYVISDWGTARQREFGQKITNWVRGQLGEIAVQKYFKNEFGVKVKLDFELHQNIVPQDIIGVMQEGKEKPAKIKVGIKASKPKNAFLVLSENEIKLPDRVSDVYIFCRPDLPDDHLLRITSEQMLKMISGMPHFFRYKKDISPLESINCEVAGWCWRKDLIKTKEIPGQKFDGWRYVKASGNLKKSKADWQKLIKQL